METFLILRDQNGEPGMNYYSLDINFDININIPPDLLWGSDYEPGISQHDSYILNNKMYGEFIKRYSMKEENFEFPENCAVCMSTPEEITRKLYIKTPCNHVFCAECLAGVIVHNSLKCPLCRTSIKDFSEFKYMGDLQDPVPENLEEFYNYYSNPYEESDLEERQYINQQEYDQTLYQLLVEYWAAILNA